MIYMALKELFLQVLRLTNQTNYLKNTCSSMLYDTHINKYCPIYLTTMTDVAVVEKRISQSTFFLISIDCFETLVVIYGHN